jgi:hypothetical protein
MDKTLEAIIKVLLEKTKAKQVNWTKSSVESQFKLILDKAAITIDFETYSDQDGEGEYDKYEVSVYNEHGNRILNEILHIPFNKSFAIAPAFADFHKELKVNGTL